VTERVEGQGVAEPPIREPITSRRLLDARPPTAVVVGGCLVLTGVITVGDYLTGPYLVFASFYLLPVAIGAWFVSRSFGLVLGLLAALGGAFGTALDPGEVTDAVIGWNALVRLVTYVLVAVLVSAERGALTEIHRLAATDPLTGLANRRRFYEQVAGELARVSRGGSAFTLVYIDVDDLKQRNDRYGHEAGDAMLVQFAELARSVLRPTDDLSRLGGDEFCILLPGTDQLEAASVVQRLMDALLRAEPLPIRISAGVLAVGRSDLEVEALVQRADDLMFEAKRAGKGQQRAGQV